MRPPTILTFADTIDYLKEFSEGRGTVSLPAYKMAVQSAYDEIVNVTPWPWLLDSGSILLQTAQTSSTITFDYTGGSVERELTIAAGTWPSWAAEGSLRIGDVLCDVESRESNTILKLDELSNPGQNVALGTSYTLYKRYYELPADFDRFTGALREGTSWMGTESSLSEIRALEAGSDTSGDVRYWAVGPHPEKYGYKGLYVWPRASTTETLLFTYWRKPRALRFSGHESECYAGTVSVTDGDTALTGSGTAFTAEMAGSVVRIGDATDHPTGRFGEHPYAQQRALSSVTTSAAAVLDANASDTAATKKYRITDPIDIDQSAHTAFLRLCEKELMLMKNWDGETKMAKRAEEALLDAMAAANPSRWEGHHPISTDFLDNVTARADW